MYGLANLQNFRLLTKEWFHKNLDNMNIPVPLSLKEPTPSVASLQREKIKIFELFFRISNGKRKYLRIRKVLMR